ncbi:OLC1v1026937C1 [Oldenlandia corymbosa var. corymbosa]|uniref:OLC1v1026937C1 n=1 Tax=Oldenlandia corymbosa var. corymbosa TaxID=529605 RepID=A0AAV1CA26_OLDCO|nr:OLC1v1026937C1 [Oldenlandia corymbosa var. corymbosa]
MRMYRARTRKRVNAIRRGPDGSAFQQCERCGFSVAIALADMHECESNDKVKKFRGWPRGGSPKTTLNYEDQPRSAFRFFMEEFVEECEEEDEVVVDRKGFEKWKKMSKEDREQYVIKAEKVNLAYIKALLEEENNIFWVNCWLFPPFFSYDDLIASLGLVITSPSNRTLCSLSSRNSPS